MNLPVLLIVLRGSRTDGPRVDELEEPVQPVEVPSVLPDIDFRPLVDEMMASLRESLGLPPPAVLAPALPSGRGRHRR